MFHLAHSNVHCSIVKSLVSNTLHFTHSSKSLHGSGQFCYKEIISEIEHYFAMLEFQIGKLKIMSAVVTKFSDQLQF